MTPAGHTPELALPEPDTGVRISLVSRLQNHDEAGTGYAGRDLLLVDSEEMFGNSRSQFLRGLSDSVKVLPAGVTAIPRTSS